MENKRCTPRDLVFRMRTSIVVVSCFNGARWALGEDEVTKMNNETGEIVKIDEKNFESFKKVYNESVEEIVKETTFDIIGNTT